MLHCVGALICTAATALLVELPWHLSTRCVHMLVKDCAMGKQSMPAEQQCALPLRCMVCVSSVYERAFRSLRDNQPDAKEEAVMLLEAWRAFEADTFAIDQRQVRRCRLWPNLHRALPDMAHIILSWSIDALPSCAIVQFAAAQNLK